ncbi:MAG: hypothetical protein HPY71_15385 [Firmicutes bacterium]|nr:hypothetical protein [Bacillota bacterium]
MNSKKEEVKEKLYAETGGQPGLVNEVCKPLVERFNWVDGVIDYKEDPESHQLYVRFACPIY